MGKHRKWAKRGSRAVAFASLALGITVFNAATATATALPPAIRCQALAYGKPVGPIPSECTARTQSAFVRLDPFIESAGASTDIPTNDAARFRGWARVAHLSACGYDRLNNPVVCGGAPVVPDSPNIAVYRYTARGWQRATLRVGTWIQAQHYSGTWEWAYANGSWYAMDKRNIEGYCQRGKNYHSNCTLTSA